jgi:hypothetical protein
MTLGQAQAFLWHKRDERRSGGGWVCSKKNCPKEDDKGEFYTSKTRYQLQRGLYRETTLLIHL